MPIDALLLSLAVPCGAVVLCSDTGRHTIAEESDKVISTCDIPLSGYQNIRFKVTSFYVHVSSHAYITGRGLSGINHTDPAERFIFFGAWPSACTMHR